jgi:hypothetical protein
LLKGSHWRNGQDSTEAESDTGSTNIRVFGA